MGKRRRYFPFQHMRAVVNSAAVMVNQNRRSVAMLPLYSRESEGVMAIKFRPARTGSEEAYPNLKSKRLFELVNDAWVKYGDEVFCGITEEICADISSMEALEKLVGADKK